MDGCKAERQSQTTEQMENLDKGIVVLQESVENLMNRLDKTLRIPTPLVSGDGEKGAEELVPLAGSIRHLKNRVANINNDIQDILNRLEL